MGSTNKTNHYELPQFVANDKPSWLGDVNEAMEAIDTGIYGAKAAADGAQQTANNAVAGVQTAGTRMDGMQAQLDTVATQANQTATTVTGHTSAIATNSANINTLNSRMGSTDISGIGDGSVTGAISSIAQGGGLTAVAQVTADGVKTTATLLGELHTQLAGVTLNPNAVLVLNAGSGFVVHQLSATTPELEFTNVKSTSSDFYIDSAIIASTGAYYESARTATRDYSSLVRTSGTKFTVYN